ncbi:MAG: hypothetical protein KC550_02465 [Nanoarchaeota archaeon]|nr:hypothetical protein [Nanoarchaeota archaeon]
MNEILRYKRDSFECESEEYYFSGEILNHEKDLVITSLKAFENLNINNLINEQLTFLLRYYWDKYNIRINSIFAKKTSLENIGLIEDLTFTLDYEFTPIHNREYQIKILD